MSLRSNGRLDVAKFAEDYFRGGGHADSAGGRLEVEPIKAAEQAVIESVKQRAKLNEEVASQNEDETSSLGDSLDPGWLPSWHLCLETTVSKNSAFDKRGENIDLSKRSVR